MGKIAVGVPLPQDDAIDFDAEDMKAETDAMGGEELPLLEVGELHGDWQLVMQNNQRSIPLIRFQLNHAEGEPTGTGGLVVEADPSWGFGPKGGFGDAILMLNGGLGLSMTIAVDGDSTDYMMIPEGAGWTTEISIEEAGTYKVLLLKADDLVAAEAAKDNAPVDHRLVAVDERGENFKTPVIWTMLGADMAEPVTFMSDDARAWDEGRAAGTYLVTATSGEFMGSHSIILGRGQRAGNLVVLKPADEGTDLALSVDFFCSAGEICEMAMSDVPVNFTLPEGWGAQRPLRIDRGIPMFNMTTNTPDGPFFVTLNQRQRDPSVGPCTELVTGTFCHDTTDDPALLGDIALIQRSLSFKPVGMWLNEDRFNTLLNQLTGDAK